MGFSAIIPVADMDAANATLEAGGFGADNFTVPLREGVSDTEATHGGLNMSGDSSAFKAAVEAVPGVSVQDAPTGTVMFAEHVTAQSLEWSDPTNWTENPVMIGDERTFDGKTWVSLVDYNVWQPPVNWREVVTNGYPVWVQPTGATDSYPLNFRVSHNDQNWQSNTPANVWEPGVFGWDIIDEGLA
jgi:hypothetical protein